MACKPQGSAKSSQMEKGKGEVFALILDSPLCSVHSKEVGGAYCFGFCVRPFVTLFDACLML